MDQEKQKPAEDIEKRKKDSLKYAAAEQGAYSMMMSIADNFIGPFALALKATVSQFGLLKSIPQAASAVFQLFSVELTDKTKLRKKYLLISAVIHLLIWIPLILCALFFRNIWVLIGQGLTWRWRR